MIFKIASSLFLLFFLSNYSQAQRIDSVKITNSEVRINFFHHNTTGYVNSNYYTSNDTCYLFVCYYDGDIATLTYDVTTVPITLPSSSGNYVFKLVTSLTNVNGVCDSSSLYDSVIIDFSMPLLDPIILSSEENLSQSEIQLYPNPAQSIISIKTNSLVYGINLFAMNGKLVKTFNTKEKQLSISEIASGIYFLKLEIANGIVIKKIIVE